MKPREPFSWELEALMHERGIHQVAELQRRLESLDVTLSSSQTHRLVTQRPERLNLTVLAALCEILTCTPDDLIKITPLRWRATKPAARASGGGDNPVVDLADTARPRRARVVPGDPPPGR